MHRAAVESLVGLRLEARQLGFHPVLPAVWPQAELTLRRDGRTLRFVFVRTGPAQALAAAVPALGGAEAELLRPGQALDWTATAKQACFVIPLLAD
ncbi:MAG TPA: hypothetical protein VK876_09965, partial [Rubrivivax sp.]|nr:hypothetical protein [Rubrivivax sp.]